MQQFITQLGRIDQVAVVAQRQRPIHGFDHKRLDVAHTRRTGGRVARMPDGVMAFQGSQGLRRKNLSDQPDVCIHGHRAHVRNGNTGGLLPAVLQREQAEKGHARHVLIGGKDTDQAALLMRAVKIIVYKHTCFTSITGGRPRSRTSTCSGASESRLINEKAVPPGLSRPSRYSAIFSFDSPSSEATCAITPGMSRLRMASINPSGSTSIGISSRRTMRGCERVSSVPAISRFSLPVTSWQATTFEYSSMPEAVIWCTLKPCSFARYGALT